MDSSILRICKEFKQRNIIYGDIWKEKPKSFIDTPYHPNNRYLGEMFVDLLM